MEITSTSNDNIKFVQKLIKSSKDRKANGLYVVEGIRMVSEIPLEVLDKIYITSECREKYLELDILSGDIVEVIEVSDRVYKAMSDTKTPQGILAIVRCEVAPLDIICSDEAPFILIVEKLQDPGNMGTIIRTSEGAGLSGIIVSEDSVDIFSPKVVRATMGAIFRVSIHISSNLEKDINILKDNGIKIYGAHLDGEDIYDTRLDSAGAFLIGNEGNGLSKEISDMADKLIKIPMEGKLESLNAATSAAIISYEVLRRRRK